LWFGTEYKENRPLTEATRETRNWLDRWAGEPYAYLTTTGRRTGQPHRIEIWFAAAGGRMYLLSGGRDRSDWVRNIQAHPRVTVELGDETLRGVASIVEPGASDDQRARELLVEKYASPADDLADWKRRSLPVVINFPTNGQAPASEPAPPS
jgi:deazaflavin-dependent oxidoreductase (nitroreductase family)